MPPLATDARKAKRRTELRLCLAVVVLFWWLPSRAAEVKYLPYIILKSPHPETDGVFGAPVTWVPDVSGDGKADILVGAPFEDPGVSPSNAGRIYIFDGATQALLRELQSPNELERNQFGFQIAGIEDVNGDGRGDVIATTSAEQVVYVMDGATGDVIHQIPVKASAVAALPDMNGDGRQDIVVTAYDQLEFYSGATGEWLNTISNPNPETGTGVGNGGNLFGSSIAGIPDVNGDGQGDVVAGAWAEDLPVTADRPRVLADAGRAYIFDGATGALLHTLTSPEERSGGQFGRSVIGMPDLNGDGRGEVAVVQAGVGGPPGHGKVYTFDGATGQLLQPTPPIGAVGNGYDFLTSVPDVNRDGRTDFLVSGWNSGSPKYYLFDGASSELLATFTGYSGPGIANPNAGLPDVNGDGRGELLISIPNNNRVLLYLSDPAIKPPEPLGLARGAEGFMIRLSGEPGSTYELQASDDLLNWSTVVKQTHASQESEYLDSDAQNKSRRFYRTAASP